MIFWIHILEKANSSARVETPTSDRCLESTVCSQVGNHTGWARFWLGDAVVEIQRFSSGNFNFFLMMKKQGH